MDTLSRIWFQNDAETINAPLRLIVPNPSRKVRCESGPMITTKRWLNGQVPARDDGFAVVWDWSEQFQTSWLA